MLLLAILNHMSEMFIAIARIMRFVALDHKSRPNTNVAHAYKSLVGPSLGLKLLLKFKINVL